MSIEIPRVETPFGKEVSQIMSQIPLSRGLSRKCYFLAEEERKSIEEYINCTFEYYEAKKEKEDILDLENMETHEILKKQRKALEQKEKLELISQYQL